MGYWDTPARAWAKNISKMSCIFRSLIFPLSTQRPGQCFTASAFGAWPRQMIWFMVLSAFNNSKHSGHWQSGQQADWLAGEPKNIVKIQQHFWIYSALIAASSGTGAARVRTDWHPEL